MADVEEEFARLRRSLSEALPEPPVFRPPVSEESLARLAEVLGCAVPDELATLLRMADGQDDPDSTSGPINFQHFLGVEEIIEFRAMLDDAVRELAEPMASRRTTRAR